MTLGNELLKVENRSLYRVFVSRLLRERPKRDDDNSELHLVDRQMLYPKPLFHFTMQKRDSTRGI